MASFIAEALTGLLDEVERTIILVRILSEENDGLWGFSPPGRALRDESAVFHVDSDDSAYVIRTLQRFGVNRTPQNLIRFYREPERMFVTFDAPGPVSLTTDGSPARNFMAHPEVNANVFLALQRTHLENYINYDVLLQTQDERGFWPSYFYPSPLFGTLLALDAFDRKPEFSHAVARALSFIADTQNDDGSWGAKGDAHATALGVAALAGDPTYKAAMNRGVAHLLASMADDGSWTSPACVWEFHADEHDVWRAYDTNRAYATARCVTALRRAVGELSPNS